MSLASQKEQSHGNGETAEVLEELRLLNTQYEAKSEV